MSSSFCAAPGGENDLDGQVEPDKSVKEIIRPYCDYNLESESVQVDLFDQSNSSKPEQEYLDNQFEQLSFHDSDPVLKIQDYFDSEAKPEDFEPIARIGKGSFGEVFLVRDHDGSQLAMKVLDKQKIADQNQWKYA